MLRHVPNSKTRLEDVSEVDAEHFMSEVADVLKDTFYENMCDQIYLTFLDVKNDKKLRRLAEKHFQRSGLYHEIAAAGKTAGPVRGLSRREQGLLKSKKLYVRYQASRPHQQFIDQTREQEERVLEAHRDGSCPLEPGSSYHRIAQDRVKDAWRRQGIWKEDWEKDISGLWKHEEISEPGLEPGTNSGATAADPIPSSATKEARDEKFSVGKRALWKRQREASRPYHQFNYQVSKERGLLHDKESKWNEGHEPDINTLAYKNVKARWLERGIWSRDWGILPGMAWKHEESVAWKRNERLASGKSADPVTSGPTAGSTKDIEGTIKHILGYSSQAEKANGSEPTDTVNPNKSSTEVESTRAEPETPLGSFKDFFQNQIGDLLEGVKCNDQGEGASASIGDGNASSTESSSITNAMMSSRGELYGEVDPSAAEPVESSGSPAYTPPPPLNPVYSPSSPSYPHSSPPYSPSSPPYPHSSPPYSPSSPAYSPSVSSDEPQQETDGDWLADLLGNDPPGSPPTPAYSPSSPVLAPPTSSECRQESDGRLDPFAVEPYESVHSPDPPPSTQDEDGDRESDNDSEHDSDRVSDDSSDNSSNENFDYITTKNTRWNRKRKLVESDDVVEPEVSPKSLDA